MIKGFHFTGSLFSDDKFFIKRGLRDSNVDQNWPDPTLTWKFMLWFLVFQASGSLLHALGAVFQCRNSGRSLFWSKALLLRHIDSFTILRARRQTRILFRIFILQVIYFQMTSFSLKSGLLDSNVDQNWPDPTLTRKFMLWFWVFQASVSLLRALGAVFQCRNSGRFLFWSEPLLLRHIDSFATLKVQRQTCECELASSGLHPRGVCLVESCWYYWFQK